MTVSISGAIDFLQDKYVLSPALQGPVISSSIIGGIAVGLCIYPVIKLLAGKGRELGWFSYLTAVLLLLYLGMAGR